MKCVTTSLPCFSLWLTNLRASWSYYLSNISLGETDQLSVRKAFCKAFQLLCIPGWFFAKFRGKGHQSTVQFPTERKGVTQVWLEIATDLFLHHLLPIPAGFSHSRLWDPEVILPSFALSVNALGKWPCDMFSLHCFRQIGWGDGHYTA